MYFDNKKNSTFHLPWYDFGAKFLFIKVQYVGPRSQSAIIFNSFIILLQGPRKSIGLGLLRKVHASTVMMQNMQQRSLKTIFGKTTIFLSVVLP